MAGPAGSDHDKGIGGDHTRNRGPLAACGLSGLWRTFLRNHADGIASMDLFVVPTISFRLLYGLLIKPGRR
jgi:hypothetical protein